MANKIGGVLAARHGWCRPDEVIRLVVPAPRGGTRYDVGGLSWEGNTGGRAVAEGVERVATAVDDLFIADYESGAAAPLIVYFGPGPQAQIMRAASVANPGVGLTWVLTSQRFALLEAVVEREERDGEPGSLWQKARRFGAGVRDFSRDVVDILADNKLADYAPGTPIPIADVVMRAEFPVQHLRSIGPARRRLPAGHSPRHVFALRIELGDGSGVDVIAATEENCARLHAMALGQR
ncbi:hypothetical protein GCM10011581_49200 [Saccharopolyspora subtropica]|uniref:Uncharacterized protein n=1 Tax=Saccharopolyspora thermophila TaxID=89367 RepID=A0A917NK33_9PSEU|nr:hypothetical protein [Saccharopolyspora subtropica]GGJ06418.1 hypothetical protein GCM10011581_49200 [Saccharopolyspora subtropica]